MILKSNDPVKSKGRATEDRIILAAALGPSRSNRLKSLEQSRKARLLLRSDARPRTAAPSKALQHGRLLPEPQFDATVKKITFTAT